MTDNNSERSRLIEKIKKLMTLAKDAGATPNEAATAARQAESMLRKYNIDAAEVIHAELKSGMNMTWDFVRPNMFKHNKAFIKKVQQWPQWIAVPCGKLYDCHVNIRLVEAEGSVIALYGYTTDVEVCKWVYEYLLDCVRQTSLAIPEVEADRAGISIRKYRDDFRTGMALAIKDKLEEAVTIKENADVKSSSCTALVVAKRRAVEEKFGSFGYTKTKDAFAKVNRDAAQRGIEAGKKVNISPNPIENKSTTHNKLNTIKQLKG